MHYPERSSGRRAGFPTAGHGNDHANLFVIPAKAGIHER
jgi:hypothetical protein